MCLVGPLHEHTETQKKGCANVFQASSFGSTVTGLPAAGAACCLQCDQILIHVLMNKTRCPPLCSPNQNQVFSSFPGNHLG